MQVRYEVRLFLATLVALLIVSMVVALPALGQSTNAGTIVGTITDPSGAIVQGAKVTITDTATGDTRSTNTNDAGHYVFVNVTPGKYTLVVGKQGFSNMTTSLEAQVGLDPSAETIS
jgi:hypothetical protein